MHPILARGRRLALYLGLWLVLASLLGALLGAQASLTGWHALIVALPLAYAYAFVCLSVWYVSRSMPLAMTGVARIIGTALAAAMFLERRLVAAGQAVGGRAHRPRLAARFRSTGRVVRPA